MPERVTVVENIFSANDQLAFEINQQLNTHRVFSINLMASPGAGKTSLIEQTVQKIAGSLNVGMINGDIATSLDADRAAAVGAKAVQINTGGECHLDAVMLKQGLAQIPLQDIDLLLVENVGNLVCPASFKLGTHKNVLIASTPEGDDKPYKYPGMYRGVDVVVINKIDLLPYITFDMDRFRRGVETLNPGVLVFEVSCRTGSGITTWTEWILSMVSSQKQSSL